MARKTYRRVITSKDLDKRINPENTKLAKRFIKDKSRTVTDTTIIGYESDLRIFFTWNLLENENVFFVDLKKLDFSDFFVYATDSENLNWGTSRQNRMRSTLSSFSNFIEKYYDETYPRFRNIVIKVIESAPKEERREKTVLSDEEVNKILSYFSEKDPQIACWFALAVFSGMRFSEILRVKVSTIRNAKDAFDGIFLYTEPIKVKGRGDRRDSKYILKKEFLPYFNLWIDSRTDDSNELFIKNNGDAVTGGIVRGWVKQIGCVINKPFYSHSARHRMTTSLSLKGIPVNLIQALMGWKSSELVSVYDDSSIHDKKWEELEVLK